MFSLCSQLGIDDPLTWMNAVPAKLVDAWFAYELLRREEEAGLKNKKMGSPEVAAKAWGALVEARTHGR